MNNFDRLGIVVVNYGSHELVAANLPAELAVAADAQVYVVDNFHSNDERAAIIELTVARGWKLIELSLNTGFGAGVNAGVRAAVADGCDVLLTLNPDAVVTAPVLRELAAEARRTPLALVAPHINTSSGARYSHGTAVNLKSGEMRGGWSVSQPDSSWRNWLTAACLAFHRDAFNAIGGMSEHYFLYWEDVDFSLRAEDVGVALILRQDLVAVHDEGGTQGRSVESSAKSNIYYYYNSRNRLIFARDHAPRSSRLRWLVETPRQTLRIWLRGGRRQLLERPGGAVAAIRGAGAGVVSLVARRGAHGPERERATLLVAHPSPDLYGSDRVLLESVSALSRSGARVVAVLPEDGPLAKSITEHGGEVAFCQSPVLRKSALSPIGLVRLAFEALRALPRMRRLVREVGADAVYVNTITIPLWVVVGRMLRVPTVCHVHEAERSLPLLLRRAMYAPLCLADRFIVNSKFTLEVVGGVWPSIRHRATLIYNAVAGPPDAPAAPRATPEPVRLLFIGRLSPRKGVQVAVEAVSLLEMQGIPASLALLGAVFPGYEWFEQELREQVQSQGIAERVHFLGFESDIWKYLHDCDILLVPSRSEESFGNVVVEAILARRPVVVSDGSGLQEASEGYDTAEQVPAGDPRAIAAAVGVLVARWAEVVARSEQDRTLALSRHSAEVYRSALIGFFRDELSITLPGQDSG